MHQITQSLPARVQFQRLFYEKLFYQIKSCGIGYRSPACKNYFVSGNILYYTGAGHCVASQPIATNKPVTPMNLRVLLIAWLYCFGWPGASGQGATRTVKGVVAEDGSTEPVPYAHVYVKRRATHEFYGTVTDLQGNFTLVLPTELMDDTLHITSIYIYWLRCTQNRTHVPSSFNTRNDLTETTDNGITTGGNPRRLRW
jgi:hypothetical protein